MAKNWLRNMWMKCVYETDCHKIDVPCNYFWGDLILKNTGFPRGPFSFLKKGKLQWRIVILKFSPSLAEDLRTCSYEMSNIGHLDTFFLKCYHLKFKAARYSWYIRPLHHIIGLYSNVTPIYWLFLNLDLLKFKHKTKNDTFVTRHFFLEMTLPFI